MTSTSMYTIIQTQKGYKAILFRQNLYRQQKVNQSGSVRWVCTNRKCSSSITIYNEKIKAIRGFHNHTNIDRSPSIIKAVQNIREKVTQNLTKPITQIYNETVANYVNMNQNYILFFYKNYLETNKRICRISTNVRHA